MKEFIDLQNLLISFLGQPKSEIGDGNLQLQFPCPRCVDERGDEEIHKYNLEITLEKNLFNGGGLFHCWSCCASDDEMKGSVYKLIKLYGNKDILREYKSIVNQIRTQSLYNVSEFSFLREDTGQEKYVTLPPTYTRIQNLNHCKKSVSEYLIKRGFTQEIIDKYKIGYTGYGEDKPSVRNRIIIPSYDKDDNLSFWVGRDFTGIDKRVKYFNSPNIDKKEIVYQEKHISWDSDILLVEGAIDAILGPPNTTALLGKTLTNDSYLYYCLMNKLNANVIICLDGDTNINETKKIYLLLNQGRLKGHVRYVIMDEYKDIADAYLYGGKSKIIEILKKQKEFKEIELLTYIA